MKNSNEVQILPATKTDYPQLAQIYQQSRKATFPWVQHPEISDFIRDSEGEYLLKAVLNQKIVGFLSFYQSANFIHLLFIDPEYMHHGVGTQLLQAIRLQATDLVTLKCVRENTNALAFYKAQGFKIIGRSLWRKPPYYTLKDTKKAAYPLL
ncbi:N-acetyltransferase family protein [Pediococcus siamensis]|uniref:GNAT family N-acetyltransferase n=1 Tax=Pediococcus siamensis TaxID=381829 RepID=UPI0039A0DFF7